MSLRTDLLKGLQNYAVFVPQLTRPVLRVLIQGILSSIVVINLLKNVFQIFLKQIVNQNFQSSFRFSCGALYRKSSLRSRST